MVLSLTGVLLRSFLTILSEITKVCYMEPGDTQSPPHQINQTIIYNAGIIFVLFDVLQRNSAGVD